MNRKFFLYIIYFTSYSGEDFWKKSLQKMTRTDSKAHMDHPVSWAENGKLTILDLSRFHFYFHVGTFTCNFVTSLLPRCWGVTICIYNSLRIPNSYYPYYKCFAFLRIEFWWPTLMLQGLARILQDVKR